MSEQERWAYSRDGEHYHGEFADWREAALEVIEGDSESSVWVGKCEEPRQPEEFINAAWLLEHIACQDDYCHDWADGWPDSSGDQDAELTEALRKTLGDWLDRHKLRPKWFGIPNGFQVTREEALDPGFDPFANKGGD